MKLMVYPSSYEATIFDRYVQLMKKYDAVYLAGPKGWTLPDYVRDKKNDYGSIPSFEDALPLCDEVLFLDTEPSPSIENLTKKMRTALQAGKKVYVDNGKKFSGLDFPSEAIQRVFNNESPEKSCAKSDAPPILKFLCLSFLSWVQALMRENLSYSLQYVKDF